MKSLISKTMALVVISTTLFSFSPVAGGEGFEIYLNNKVVLQRFGNNINTVQSLQLSVASQSDQLSIKYHHCGKIGKDRVVTIKDSQNKVLKEFRYPDATTPVAAMKVPVKDIIDLKKGSSTLKLYYTSSELPAGRMLVTINTRANGLTQP